MGDSALPFTRYVWCYSCQHFDAHTMKNAHDRAMSRPCPACGSVDIASLPPSHHSKRLLSRRANAVAEPSHV